MHKVDQDVVVSYTFVTSQNNFLRGFEGFEMIWWFLRWFEGFDGFWGFLRLFMGFFATFLIYIVFTVQTKIWFNINDLN